MFRIAVLALAATTLAATGAAAATLTGDQVAVTFNPTGGTSTGTVGGGPDIAFGVFEFDFDAGAGGDGFLFEDNGGFFSNSDEIVLSSLAFTDGEELVGFDLTSTSLTNLSFTVTADSVTFSFDAVAFGPDAGPAIEGRFLTAPAVVPLPASMALLGAGLTGLAALRRRRR